MGKQVRHRGPDWSGNHTAKNTILVHERLSIVGVDTGAQPMLSDDGSIALAVNGEIYNHKILRKRLAKPYPFKTHSDCEIIIPLYQEHGIDAPKYLDGMFSWVLHDKQQDRLVAARDPIGITTFYMGRSSTTPGAVYFASELKCLFPVCDKIEFFPPGHVYDSKTDKLTRYFTPNWLIEPSSIPTTPLDLGLLRETFERSVRKRMMAEVPFGVLLSGKWNCEKRYLSCPVPGLTGLHLKTLAWLCDSSIAKCQFKYFFESFCDARNILTVSPILGGLDSSLVASIAQRETLRLQKEYARKQAFLNSGVNTPQMNGDINGQLPIADSNGNIVEDELAGKYILPPHAFLFIAAVFMIWPCIVANVLSVKYRYR